MALNDLLDSPAGPPLVIPAPYAEPWKANREGGVIASDTTLIGYARFDRIGDLTRVQAATRFWAASPDLANALVALSLAAESLIVAVQAKQGVRAAAEAVAVAQRRAHEALQRLLDPMLTPNAAANAPIAAILLQLPGAPEVKE